MWHSAAVCRNRGMEVKRAGRKGQIRVEFSGRRAVRAGWSSLFRPQENKKARREFPPGLAVCSVYLLPRKTGRSGARRSPRPGCTRSRRSRATRTESVSTSAFSLCTPQRPSGSSREPGSPWTKALISSRTRRYASRIASSSVSVLARAGGSSKPTWTTLVRAGK